MHSPLSFGCNFSCKVQQDLAVGVAGDERRWRCLNGGCRWTTAIRGRFITVQLAGGSIADSVELHFFAPGNG
ncbi:MAG: hypothetical protein ABI158_05685 [Edaphobacter sp.]